MSFKDQSWGNRFNAMGDEAENQFEEWATASKVGFCRYGLDRPPIQVGRLPHFVRFTPDYLMTKRFVEVQGFGRDQLFKLKDEKLVALEQWSKVHPVSLFAWNRTNQTRLMVDLGELTALVINDEVPMGKFPEGKPYFEFSAAILEEVGELL